jgi:diadenosine tetraphosphate (Ap4A) HIT family hydrolase
MPSKDTCPFCDRPNLASRTIRSQQAFSSFVSDPWFRAGQCLVIPNRHVTTLADLTAQEGAAIMTELGRLSDRLDTGYGYGIMQKYQPRQPDNGIKVSHLHFHVFPRFDYEAKLLFPVPEPNSFDGFSRPSDEEVAALVQKLR